LLSDTNLLDKLLAFDIIAIEGSKAMKLIDMQGKIYSKEKAVERDGGSMSDQDTTYYMVGRTIIEVKTIMQMKGGS
jgi:hypothetical protein